MPALRRAARCRRVAAASTLHPRRMSCHRHQLSVATTAALELVDLTAAVRQWVRGTGVRDGLLTVTSAHTTARLTVNEREPRLQADMVRFLGRLAPPDDEYAHNAAPVDGRRNAHAHLLGLFLGTTETLPVVAGDVLPGDWQALFLVELDGPRPARQVHLQLLGADP